MFRLEVSQTKRDESSGASEQLPTQSVHKSSFNILLINEDLNDFLAPPHHKSLSDDLSCTPDIRYSSSTFGHTQHSVTTDVIDVGKTKVEITFVWLDRVCSPSFSLSGARFPKVC